MAPYTEEEKEGFNSCTQQWPPTQRRRKRGLNSYIKLGPPTEEEKEGLNSYTKLTRAPYTEEEKEGLNSYTKLGPPTQRGRKRG